MARAKDSSPSLHSLHSLQEFIGFTRSMDRMLNSLLLPDGGQPASIWRPPTDVYETENAVVVLVEIAGMDPEEIQVEFSDKILRVTGARVDHQRRAAAHCLEVQYGEFASEVYLPGQYALDEIAADYQNGFLTITLPKARTETRTIAVQAQKIADLSKHALID